MMASRATALVLLVSIILLSFRSNEGYGMAK
jgi:hypothetical protein